MDMKGKDCSNMQTKKCQKMKQTEFKAVSKKKTSIDKKNLKGPTDQFLWFVISLGVLGF